MTPQEQQMIDDLIQRIRSTQLTEKDADAEQRLNQGLAGYPDAVYVLAQTVLVQKYGLEQAQQHLQSMQAEIDQLHQQLGTQPKPASFLSKLFGTDNTQPPPASYQPNAGGYPPPPYAAPGYPPQYTQPVYSAPSGGGFLRSAMQTAAGVAAGEFAFQGIESLFHGFGGGGGFGGGYGYSGLGEQRPEVINNYYDDQDRGNDRDFNRADSTSYNPSTDTVHEVSNETGDASSFDDSSNATFDDASYTDDSSSNDDFSSGGDDLS